ncbi:WhiB family transcriptional regulator [uncultured Modestobacter sp.]|uniref:WhiB family transcriptional regulator n=1 Tax=uncultured Modestobacter sp. TaxID=380048 RepID=UPI003443A4E4
MRAAQAAYARLGAAVASAGSTPCRSAARPDAWHEDVGAEGAASLCAGCPVLAECRAYAVAAREPHGVWGGLTWSDRRRLAVRRRAEVAAAV